MCERWSDHEWSEGRHVESGRDPVNGPFVRWRLSCTRPGCTRTMLRTDWQGEPPVRPVRLKNE